MIRGFYSAASGMKAQQTTVDVIANNLANVNTASYKSKVSRFNDLLYSSMASMGEVAANPGELSVGNGTVVSGTVSDMSQGTPESTGSGMDYCINGTGFFEVRDLQGNTYFTRDGSFQAVPGAAGLMLTDAGGREVVDIHGNPITVGGDGNPSAVPGVFDFSNSEQLQPVGDNLYMQTARSGAPAATQTVPRQGYLESSNVDIASQMTGLIMSERSYQLNSKVVQTADDIENMANSLR